MTIVMSPGASVHAPAAPGRLGQSVPASTMLSYLDELGRWRSARKAELDRLDGAALAAGRRDELTGDVTLAMAMWQATSNRYDEIVEVWDSGRAGRGELDRCMQLIWGRLDAGLGAGLSVSLVEACRLSDALVAQLREQLSFDPSSADVAARIAAVRAQLERCRDYPRSDPAVLHALARQVEPLAASAARGGDVTSRLQHVEAAAARTERDLIVGAATRRNAARDAERARADLVTLRQRGEALAGLAERVRAAVRQPPRLAVPNVATLGEPPGDPDALATYLMRLSAVTAAVSMAESAYAAPLSELQSLRGLLAGYRQMAAARGSRGSQLAEAMQAAAAALDAVPVDLAAARTLVSRYQELVRAAQNAVQHPEQA